MRTLIAALAALALMLGVSSPASAGDGPDEITATLVDTEVLTPERLIQGDDPGATWTGGPWWHVRGAEIVERMDAGGTTVGTLTRTVSFDLNTLTGFSTAWCSFTMVLESPALGDFSGHCRGSLSEGSLIGNGVGGHVSGTYALASGGVPGLGPYVIRIEVTPR